MHGGRSRRSRMGNSNQARTRLLRGWARVRAAAAHARMRIVVVGGGAGGVELALAMHSQLRNEAEFTIIHAGPHLLPRIPFAREVLLTAFYARAG